MSKLIKSWVGPISTSLSCGVSEIIIPRCINKAKYKISVLEYFLILTLIFQLVLLLSDILSNNNLILNELNNHLGHIFNMSDNNANNSSSDKFTNIPNQNNNYNSMIRTIAVNAAALAARTPRTRAVSLILGNTYSTLTDIITNEEKANYWIDQYTFYQQNGRLRGGSTGEGPFEREFNPFNGDNKFNDTSRDSSYLPSTDSPGSEDYNFIQNILLPAEHTIPTETLVNQHLIIILALFVLVLALIMLVVFFYLDLMIILNKDYFLNNVNNKYIKMYVKYVLFKTKFNLIFEALIILLTLLAIAYFLLYLIKHPIILG